MIFKVPTQLRYVGLLLLTFGIIQGCGRTSSTTKISDEISPVVLVQQDLDNLQSGDTSALSQYDTDNHGLITKIFGGTTGSDLSKYINTRLQYFIAEDETDVDFTPHSALSAKYQEDENGASEKDQMSKSKVEIGAANIGMGVWFASIINQKPVTFVYHGSKIAVDSSRVGVMLIGSGYKASVKTSSGKTYTIPAEFRQSTLIHEARHSDCTGGITQADLALARSVAGSNDFDKRFTAKACGHLHSICPASHEYHDLHACDSEAWGAYTIGAVYLRGILNSKTKNTMDWEFMNAETIDFESRTLVERTGTPDMSSAGVRD